MSDAPRMPTDRSGYAGRMRRYLHGMFPLPSRLGFAALIYVATALFTAGVHGGGAVLPPWPTALGIGNVLGAFLTLRLMDELKDRDIDARLFPERPLPSGLVREGDIRCSLLVVVVALLAANSAALETLVAAAVVLGFATLMCVHFFARAALEASLPLTLATHQPIVPLVLLQALVVAGLAIGRTPGELRWDVVIPFVVLLWMPFLGWEICRKIRAPEQETEYVTYSRILGPRGAVAFAVSAQALALAAGVYLHAALSLSAAYLAVLVVAGTLVLWGHVRFVRRPVPERAVLRVHAEALLIVLAALQILEFGVLS